MKVLVALDSSLFADAIVREAAARSWPSGTEILLMTAICPAYAQDERNQCIHEGEMILKDRRNRLQTRLTDCIVHADVVEDEASAAILKCAETFGADLILLGSHGDTGVHHNKLGSVAAAVVNNAPCSVEVIKVERPDRGKHGHRALNAVR